MYRIRRHLILLAATAGLLGGGISNGLFGSQLLSEASDSRLPSFKPSAAAKQTFGVIQATELQIVNSQGRIVAVLGADGVGNGALTILNNNGITGSVVASLRVNATDGNGLVQVANNDGDIVAGLEVNGEGNGLVAALNTDGTGGSFLGIDESGHGAVAVTYKEGPLGAQMFLNGNTPEFETRSSAGIQ